jgi:3-isopropylmalate/(R)-2-methylmalate dehydratase small subunit
MNHFPAFESRLAPLLIDNIDTDQIFPARFLKTVSKEGLADQLFFDWRYDSAGDPKPDFLLNQKWAKSCHVLLAGDNFGSGSSREHAPWALTQYGFRAIVSTSFADIFRNNALKNSLLPIVVSPEVHRNLVALREASADATVKIDLVSQSIALPDGTVAHFPVDEFAKYLLIEGVDELGWVLSQDDVISEFESRRTSPIDTNVVLR